MIETDVRPIFTSVGQALHVAWLMEIMPVTQKVSTQVLIESIREQLGKTEARVSSTINMGGMSPLEFRGQTAMVRGACQHHLSEAEFDAVRVRFGWQRSQAAGVAGFARYVAPLAGIENDLALRALIWHRYSHYSRRGLTPRKIEAETGVTRNKLRRAQEVISSVIDRLEHQAEDALLPLFQRDGLVWA